MQYNDILKKIEQDFHNDNRTDLYRYNGLLEAIRFFQIALHPNKLPTPHLIL